MEGISRGTDHKTPNTSLDSIILTHTENHPPHTHTYNQPTNQLLWKYVPKFRSTRLNRCCHCCWRVIINSILFHRGRESASKIAGVGIIGIAHVVVASVLFFSTNIQKGVVSQQNARALSVAGLVGWFFKLLLLLRLRLID